ncbi:helix-turn-helix transcriptional regulator [Paenibacillus antibioticophila]|uniref:helix-turn-helix transcriptional regulator n=1 Tax=Paenibacillus antibioticophila TaxID=1274374 RepID=UPI0005C90E2A|nr:AraC family transcriptional regulator [Paenibacillus antibioticophila]
MDHSFYKVLQLSDLEEKKRIDRSLDELMEDEYQLNDNMRKLIEDQQYVFPSLNQNHATPDMLIRTQDTISAKKHHYSTTPYFHRHDFIEMVYVYKGLCYQYIESQDQLMILNEGELFILNQNVLHALYQPNPEDIIIKMIIPPRYLGFEFGERQEFQDSILDFLTKSVMKRSLSYHYLHFRTASNPLIRTFVERLVTEYYQKADYFEDAMCYYLKLLFVELSRSKSIINSMHFEMKTKRLQHEQLLNYVRENMQTITLDQLANEFSYNKCYLSRLISEEFGESFQKIVRDIRMGEIEKLIRYTNLSIEQIAERVGYKNAVIIYKMIREKYNMTPSEFRKNR